MEQKVLYLALLLANFAVAQEIATSGAPLFTANGAGVSQPELSTANSLAASTTALPPISNNKTSYRLPENVLPDHYKLEIKTYLKGENSRFEGHVRIRIKCDVDTPEIVLHSKELDLNTGAVKVTEIASGRNLGISAHEFDKENDFYIIKLNEELQSGQKYLIDIPFSGNLTNNLVGYFKSTHQDKATGDNKLMGATQFEAIDARRAFPCFDEPAMKAAFQVNLIRQKGFSSISNMPLAKSVRLDDDWYRDEFEESVLMSTYLVAFIVSDVAYLESNLGNTTFRVWARPDAIAQAKYSLEIGPKVLAFFEEYFDVPYPLPKMDMIAVPDFPDAGMENWGLVIYGEKVLLYEEGKSSVQSKESVTAVVAHELAHQWFGNLVTMKWWDDIWLNEGFASYVGWLGSAHVQPTWSFIEDETVNALLKIFSLDSLKSSHPVSVNIKHPSEIWQVFDSISYSKGSLILRMLNHVLGEGTFKRGVNRYLKNHLYSNAVQDVLWKSFEEQAQLDSAKDYQNKADVPQRATIKEIMDSWTLQTGYPVIKVTRNYEEGTAELSQIRFVANCLDRSSDKSLWWVPISYADPLSVLHESSIKPRFWLHTSNATLTRDLPKRDNWLLLNVNVTGVYRVNYDVENWKLLSAALMTEENYGGIPTLNRVQIVDDAFNLASAGLLDYSIALNILRYLRFEREYLPWKAAFSNLAFFSKMTKRNEGYGPYRKFVRALLTPVYNALDKPFETRADDTLPQHKHRDQVLAWSCSFEVSDCQVQANNLFKSWQEQSASPDEVNPIPVDRRKLVYCTAVKSGGESTWDFLWNRFLSSADAAEKSRLISALGCAEEMWLLHRYLDMSLNTTAGIRKTDAYLVFRSVASSPIGFYVAREFLSQRVKDIHAHVSPDKHLMGHFVQAVSNSMSTKYDLEHLKTFTTINAEYLKEAKFAVQQALESVQLNVDWHSKYYQTVIESLASSTNEEYFA